MWSFFEFSESGEFRRERALVVTMNNGSHKIQQIETIRRHKNKKIKIKNRKSRELKLWNDPLVTFNRPIYKSFSFVFVISSIHSTLITYAIHWSSSSKEQYSLIPWIRVGMLLSDLVLVLVLLLPEINVGQSEPCAFIRTTRMNSPRDGKWDGP